MFKTKLFKEFVSLVIIVAGLHLLAIKFYLYWSVYEFDSLMHFLGGVLISALFIWLYFYSGWFQPKERKFVNFFLISFFGIISIATLWEIFELIFGVAFVTWQEYPYDTTLDYIMDFLGAIAMCFYAYIKEMDLQKLEDKESTNESKS